MLNTILLIFVPHYFCYIINFYCRIDLFRKKEKEKKRKKKIIIFNIKNRQ